MQTVPTEQKQRPAHLFKPGQSGNPNGRPKGSLSRAGELMRVIASKHAGRIMQTVVKAAENGDMVAAKLLLERLWPIAKAEANITLNQLNLQGMSDVELARRMALMMRSLLDQSSQVIDAQAQSPDQPTDAGGA